MIRLLLVLALGASPLADIGPAPATRLTDIQGKPFALDSLRGKAVVVSFVYTTCTGTCPATTLRLRSVQDALQKEGLWGKKVHFVSVTLDPTRDRAEVLADYARLYKADPSAWHFLTGPPDQVAKVLADWGMWAKVGPSGVLDHPSRVFLVDPQGRQREIYSLEFLTPKTVVQDVKTVLGERSAPEATH